MKILQFKCTLLSDIILNQKSATEGNRTTLDFIPGSNFLGIVAGQLYNDKLDKIKALQLFHTGEVKFGDAHPAWNGIRGLRIPASMYYPKLGTLTDQCYIHHFVPINSEDIKNKQLKQCRSGFYAFNSMGLYANEISVKKRFAIKSSYDKEKRRSKDGMIYGYESLPEGLELLFEVVLDDNCEYLEHEIKDALVGKRRVGRSRTSQYGLVEIETCSYEVTPSLQNDSYTVIYADSRLIFLDEYGMPTFCPTVADLGIVGGEILWEKSQIRTFQYAPWNFKRQTYDADRCGIEKGSVFIVKGGCIPSSINYVGLFQNEGFGKVIYNPDFLQGQSDGKAVFAIHKCIEPVQDRKNKMMSDSGNPLLSYLCRQQQKEAMYYIIYEFVNDFVRENKEKFQEEVFASQWGGIRRIVMNRKNFVSEIKEYLNHGVAASKWAINSRKDSLESFIDAVNNIQGMNNYYLQEAIINLASEMAKVSRKG